MQKTCSRFDLLHNHDGVIRLPFLIKGRLVAPAEIEKEQIEAAFREAEKDSLYLKIPGAQIIRAPVVDRQSLSYTGEYLYQVMPPVDGRQLPETDFDSLARSLYALSVDDILDYLESVSETLLRNPDLLVEARQACLLTAGYPEAFLDASLATIGSTLDRDTAQSMIDNELSLWGRPGRDFLNGWVKVPAQIFPGPAAILSQTVFSSGTTFSQPSAGTGIRAFPTRQLHITAGNAPEVPVISTLRAILTKSAAVIKLPFDAVLPGALLALAAAAAQPDHPLTRHLSLVYWQGGDEEVERSLYRPGAFDRIVVWGSPETVTAVQSRSLFTRTICLNPRYGVSLIGRQVFSGRLEDAARLSSVDSLIYNQKACTASLVHYIEADGEQANRYAEALQEALSRWDESVPHFVSPSAGGQVKRLRRGKYLSARWLINTREERFASGVAVIPEGFDILDHPLCRLVIVRPVDKLEDALKYLDSHVSTAGVFPEERRISLRDSILARGVSSVLPLGQCERLFAGMPQDGMPVLAQLVDWKNS